jgi:hypothetical protein
VNNEELAIYQASFIVQLIINMEGKRLYESEI